MSMNDLASQRCLIHPNREAAARCPECGRFFCRECVVEHDSRLLCASCLAKLYQPSGKKRFRILDLVVKSTMSIVGFLILWLFFYYLGRALVSIPSSFHEGTVWEKRI